jgi:DNA-binding LacI/PurR family transcriptional regulator
MPSTKSTNVTIYEVAADAGVAISTVSKVLSKKNNISKATRLKVMEAIDRLGYTPSLAARGLTQGKTGIIGLLIPETAARIFADPHLMGNIQGVEEVLNERDYNLLFATAKKTMDPGSSYERLLRGRYFDGAIVNETEEIYLHDLDIQFSAYGRPWVMMGNPVGSDTCYAVYADDFLGGQLAARHLLSLGHRRIAIVNASPRPSSLLERIRGYQSVLSEYGLETDDPLMAYGDFTFESGYQIAPGLLNRRDRPTAIFSLNDRMALGILRWAQENNLQIPRDLSVIGFDDIPASANSTPPLTTICQPSIEMGKMAANLLFRLIEGEKPPMRCIVPTELVIRSSTGPVKIS